MLECSVTVTHHKAFSCSHYINVRMQLPLSSRNSFHFHSGSTGLFFFFFFQCSTPMRSPHCICRYPYGTGTGKCDLCTHALGTFTNLPLWDIKHQCALKVERWLSQKKALRIRLCVVLKQLLSQPSMYSHTYQ